MGHKRLRTVMQRAGTFWDNEVGNRGGESSRLGVAVATTALTRPADRAVIAGVCAGLADRFGMKPNTVRLLFVLSCLLPGPQVIIYLVLWLIMPKRPS